MATDGDRDPEALLAKLEAVVSVPPTAETIAACDDAIAVLAGDGATSPAARLTSARALFEKARALSHLERRDESRAVVAELVARYEHDPEPSVRRLVCRAFFGQAKDRLADGVDRRVVIVDYRHILHIAERLPPIDDLAAAALYHVALTHGKIAIERSNDEHREKSAERFLDVERRFAESRDPVLAYWVARSAMSYALTHSVDDARPIYEKIFERYANASDPALQKHAAAALAAWAKRALSAGQTELAASVADRALATFSPSEDDEIRAHIASCESISERARELP